MSSKKNSSRPVKARLENKPLISLRTSLAIRLLAGWLLLMMVGACAPTPPPPPAPQALAPQRASQVLAALNQRRQGLKSLTLQGEILAQTPQGELSGEHLIQARFPNQLKVQVMGPFGRPAILILCDDQRMVVVDYQGNRAFMGASSRANLARFLALPLTVEEALMLMSGLPAPYSELLPLVGPADQAEQLRIKLAQPSPWWVRFTLDVSEPALDPLRAWFWTSPEGEPIICQYSNPLSQGDLLLPRRVEMGLKGRGKVLLENDSISFNPELSPQVFQLTLPPGLKVENLSN